MVVNQGHECDAYYNASHQSFAMVDNVLPEVTSGTPRNELVKPLPLLSDGQQWVVLVNGG